MHLLDSRGHDRAAKAPHRAQRHLQGPRQWHQEGAEPQVQEHEGGEHGAHVLWRTTVFYSSPAGSTCGVRPQVP